MSELVYINAAKSFRNPKTGVVEDIRAKEIAHLNALKEQGFAVIGLEMTEPSLAELCDRNIDPQHTDGQADMCCAKLIAEKAPEMLGWFKSKDLDKVVFVTNRVDVDSVAAFVLADRYLKGEKVSLNDSVEEINAHDTATRAPWGGPKEKIEDAFNPDDKAKALAASIQVFRVTPDNIKDVAMFIDTGEVRDSVMESFKASQQAIIAKVKSGEIEVHKNASYTYVLSTEKAATDVGYAFSPVVIAENPRMPGVRKVLNPEVVKMAKEYGIEEEDIRKSETLAEMLKGADIPFEVEERYTYRKVSICQHPEGGYVNMKAVASQLAAKEPGWGGSPTFTGSPTGQDSVIDISDIKQIVFANLTPEYKAKATAHAQKDMGGKGMDK